MFEAKLQYQKVVRIAKVMASDGVSVLERLILPGTHRGHNKLFLAAPRTPSSASVFP
jgi:hypothetical protein